MFCWKGLCRFRLFIVGILLLAGPFMAEAAPPAIPLAGTYSGLTVQCKGGNPVVKKGSKGALKNFKQYRAGALKVLQSKMKGKKKAAIKAAAAALTKDLNKLERTLIEKCEDANGLCFNPRIRVLDSLKTSRCLASMDAVKLCDTSTMRCTNSVPGSCACDGIAEPATPTPTPTPIATATPTPIPPQGGGGSGSPIGGDGPINGISINLQSIYLGTSHTLFVNNLSGGAAGASLNSFFSSISENGIIGGGYYVRPKVETNPPEGHPLSWTSTGLHNDDQWNTTIIPFLEYKGKVHEACSWNSCPSGYVLTKVNESGIAIGDAPAVFNSPKNTFEVIPYIGECFPADAVDINSSNVLLVRHMCRMDAVESTYTDMYSLYAPQGRFEMSQKALKDAYEPIYRERALESLKREMIHHSVCSGDELNGIVLGEITEPPQFVSSGMNNVGDVFGVVNDRNTSIQYGGTCGEGTWSPNGIKPAAAFWVVRRDGTITFLDDGGNLFLHEAFLGISTWDYKAQMNDRRVMVSDGIPYNEDTESYWDVEYPLALSAAHSGSNWTKVPLVPATYGYKRSLALNNQNEVVGYGLQSVSSSIGNAWKSAHAIASLRAGPLDLNSLIPGSDWVLARANDINDCGEIVGLAYNPKLDLFRGFLLSPKGCR